MARDFDGAGDYLTTVDTSIAWGIGTGNCTFGGWFWSDNQGGGVYKGGMSFGTTSTNAPALFLRSNASDIFSCYWGGNRIFDTTFSTGQWYHAICRRTSTGADGLQGFVGGVQEATTRSASASFSEASWTIGAGRAAGSFPMDGRAAECALWGTDLSDEEIAALAGGFAPSMVRPDQLLGYIPLIRDEDRDITGLGAFTPAGDTAVIEHPRIIYRRSASKILGSSFGMGQRRQSDPSSSRRAFHAGRQHRRK